MIKNSLRTIGFGCILAGGILYFTGDLGASPDADVKQLHLDLDSIRTELTKTKEALAIAQTASSADGVSQTVGHQADDVTTGGSAGNVPPSNSSIKTVLTIAPGSNTTIVAALLEQSKIIENAAAFEIYLADHKLAGKLQIGTYELDSSMDFEIISKIITKTK